ncbi:class I SAM-dependent methyltransferase [Evansella sp. AB-P1]|uniref:class I SAM-dependent methyltransferase n=1 Tax=Evansella sp. AB-P1 TaxID=3037653 RepID=UPI00241C557F|nr:class I SAM-dependent methyltransferase [Evansella sp. AB-P1]MDG5786810.1 class I SAM-dependent methyltransferase [Evansella sp. AB-P1]
MNEYMDMLAAYGVTSARPGGKLMTNTIFEKHPLKKNSAVLELGCGLGDTAKFLVDKWNVNIDAMDINKKMLQKAKVRHKREKNINWIVGDFTSYEFPQKNYDGIVAESVLSFTNVPESLKLLNQRLNNDGKLYFLEPIYLGGLLDKEIQEYKDFYGFQHLYTENEWKEVCSSKNFSTIDIVRSYDIPEIDGTDNVFPELVIDNNLNKKHIEILEKHNELTENYFAYFDFAYFVSKRQDN